MALLLFEEPEKSPLGHFLSHGYRHETADLLNASILASETRAGDGRIRLPVMLRLLLWLEARADEVVKNEWGNDETRASGLSHVPRIRLGGEVEEGSLGWSETVFGGAADAAGAAGAAGAGGREDMDMSEQEDVELEVA